MTLEFDDGWAFEGPAEDSAPGDEMEAVWRVAAGEAWQWSDDEQDRAVTGLLAYATLTVLQTRGAANSPACPALHRLWNTAAPYLQSARAAVEPPAPEPR